MDKKLKFRIITNTNDLDTYLQKVENYTGVRLPLDYALSAKVIGVYLENCLVAGYMLVTKPGFRSLLFVPDNLKRKNPFFKIDPYEMMEVNGLWIGPAVKSPKAQFRVWISLITNIFLSKKRFLLLLSDSRNQTIHSIHSLTNPTCLYEGVPHLTFGKSTHKLVRVGYTTRWNLIVNLPKYYLEYRKREIRAKKTLIRNTFSPSRNWNDKPV